jgi:hypothetical protein
MSLSKSQTTTNRRCHSEPFAFAQDRLREEWSEWDERHGRLSHAGQRRVSRETNDFNLRLSLRSRQKKAEIFRFAQQDRKSIATNSEHECAVCFGLQRLGNQ